MSFSEFKLPKKLATLRQGINIQLYRKKSFHSNHQIQEKIAKNLTHKGANKIMFHPKVVNFSLFF